MFLLRLLLLLLVEVSSAPIQLTVLHGTVLLVLYRTHITLYVWLLCCSLGVLPLQGLWRQHCVFVELEGELRFLAAIEVGNAFAGHDRRSLRSSVLVGWQRALSHRAAARLRVDLLLARGERSIVLARPTAAVGLSVVVAVLPTLLIVARRVCPIGTASAGNLQAILTGTAKFPLLLLLEECQTQLETRLRLFLSLLSCSVQFLLLWFVGNLVLDRTFRAQPV